LILQQVLRRPLSKDKSVDQNGTRPGNERFYPVDGDNFVLRYSEAITLNVQYVKLTAATPVEVDSPGSAAS
jgi:phage gp45-like